MADDGDKEAYKERLQAAIWHYTNQIIKEEEEALETSTTPQFVSALADLVYAQAAHDLESFAGHAKRSIINVEDVKLCCRRNEGLGDVIQEYIEELERRKRLDKEAATQRAGTSRATASASRGRGRGRGL